VEGYRLLPLFITFSLNYAMQKFVYALVIVFMGVLLYWVWTFNSLSATCGNLITSADLSPDKNYKLVVFVRDCGATTGKSTQVAIMRSDKSLSDEDSGNVLVLGDRYAVGQFNKYGGPEVKVSWLSDDSVLVEFDRGVETFTKLDSLNEIKFVYQPLP
jgi:Family of unknown function (DUF5412)